MLAFKTIPDFGKIVDLIFNNCTKSASRLQLSIPSLQIGLRGRSEPTCASILNIKPFAPFLPSGPPLGLASPACPLPSSPSGAFAPSAPLPLPLPRPLPPSLLPPLRRPRSSQILLNRYHIRIPSSVVLLIIGGTIGWITWGGGTGTSHEMFTTCGARHRKTYKIL